MSKRFSSAYSHASLLALLGVAGCAARQPSTEVPVLSKQDLDVAGEVQSDHHARKPDGVVVEPPPALPDPADRAEARGVVALREPLGADAVTDIVLAVIAAWQHESLEQLTALLTADAGPMEARGRGRSALIESWRQRLRSHEYRRLAGVNLVRSERIERYGWEDLGARDEPARPPDMAADELYLRVPLEVTRVSGERLFGDTMLLLVRREDGKYKIVAYGESDEH